MCRTREVLAFLMQVVSFLQLLWGSPRPAGKHSCGQASLKGVKQANTFEPTKLEWAVLSRHSGGTGKRAQMQFIREHLATVVSAC